MADIPKQVFQLLLFLGGALVVQRILARPTGRKDVHVESIGALASDTELLQNSPISKRKKHIETPFSPSFQYVSAVDNKRGAEPLIIKIDATPSTSTIVIGIAGGSGSGKTTLAKAIFESIGEEHITFISHDSYYKDLSHLTVDERAKQNFDHPHSLDSELLIEHVKMLKQGIPVNVPSYDFTTHSRVKEVTLAVPRRVVLVEGILIFAEEDLVKLMDVKIFVDTDDDIRLIRRIQRDMHERGRTLNSVVNQYMTTVRPMHIQFVEPSKRNADIIVPVGLNSVALDLVVSRLKAHLSLAFTPTASEVGEQIAH